MTRTSVVAVVGELFLTAGLVMLLFAGYLVWGTSWASAREQEDLSGSLDAEWAAPVVTSTAPGQVPEPTPGRPFLKIYVPAFGADNVRTVLEGVAQRVLAAGPGHYPASQLPGRPGNVAIAGHRVGHGAPFGQAGELRSCDAIVLETRDAWFVYRVLPQADERGDWADRAGARARCRDVSALTGPYADTVGSEVVTPARTDVIAPVPHRVGTAPTVPLLTLTTCHPRFSARERLIVHGMQTGRYDKRGRDAGWRPAELTEG